MDSTLLVTPVLLVLVVFFLLILMWAVPVRLWVEAVFAGQAEQKQSHVHRVITRSVRGEFGATPPHVWLSPLASMFWFFDAHTVARTHHFLDELRTTDSIASIDLDCALASSSP